MAPFHSLYILYLLQGRRERKKGVVTYITQGRYMFRDTDVFIGNKGRLEGGLSLRNIGTTDFDDVSVTFRVWTQSFRSET